MLIINRGDGVHGCSRSSYGNVMSCCSSPTDQTGLLNRGVMSSYYHSVYFVGGREAMDITEFKLLIPVLVIMVKIKVLYLVCINIYKHTGTYFHTHTHTQTHISIHIYTHTETSIHAYLHIYAHAYVHTRTDIFCLLSWKPKQYEKWNE